MSNSITAEPKLLSEAELAELTRYYQVPAYVCPVCGQQLVGGDYCKTCRVHQPHAPDPRVVALASEYKSLTAQLDAARQEAERAKQQLAALSSPGEAGVEELARWCYVRMQSGLPCMYDCRWDYLTNEFKDVFKAVASRLSLQHRQQVAELTAELAQLRQRADKRLESITHYLNSITEAKEEIERLSWELASLRNDLAAAKEQLAARDGELERVQRACEPLKKYYKFVLSDAEWSKAQDGDVFSGFGSIKLKFGDMREFLAALSTLPATQPAEQPARAISAELEDGLQAMEAEQPAHAFRCPKCGGTKLFKGSDEPLVCDSASCDWSGTWAEVAAAKGGEGK